jgi:RimJ/RimL family protein N-acetyltransferase
MALELRWISAPSLEAELANDRDRLASEIVATVTEWPPDGGEWDRDAMWFFRQAIDDPSFDPQWGPAYVVDDGRLVASAGFLGPPDGGGEVEVGFSVCRCERRRGVGAAAVALLCEIAARKGCRSIRAHTTVENTPAVATLQRNAFRLVERFSVSGNDRRVLFRRRLP